MTSLMNLGAMIAAVGAGVFGAYLGRKPALWLACLLCSAAVAVQIGTTTAAGLYVGRFLLGCANGFFVIFSTVYCSEAAPAHLRE
jgi:MFS family permease